MAHVHTSTADHTDAVLAAFLQQGELPDIAKRVNMSLAALANWASAHAQLLTNLDQLLATRAKLLAAQLEVAALSALAAVSSSSTSADEPNLRERALERQRKAANAILRHKLSLERTRSAPSPRKAGSSVIDKVDDDEGRSSIAECPMANAVSSLDALTPFALPPQAPTPSSGSTRAPKPSLAERFATRRLAALQLS